MKAILLDTHAFLWFLFDDSRLSEHVAALIEDTQVEKWLSKASLWEIAIKHQIGKLSLGMDLESFFEQHVEKVELRLLDMELVHLLAYGNLPLHHRDPFDRMLVAQASTLGIPLVTVDAAFAAYNIETVWD